MLKQLGVLDVLVLLMEWLELKGDPPNATGLAGNKALFKG